MAEALKEKILRKIYAFSEAVNLIAEMIILGLLATLIGLVTYYTLMDLGRALNVGSAMELQFLIDDILLILVFVELLRSIMAAYRKRELYLVAVGEVAFIVAVREVILSVITRTAVEVVLSSLSVLIIAGALWLIVKKVSTQI